MYVACPEIHRSRGFSPALVSIVSGNDREVGMRNNDHRFQSNGTESGSRIGFVARRVSAVAALIVLVLSSIVHSGMAQDATPASEAPEVRFGILPTDPEYGGFFEDVIINPGESKELSISILNLGDEPVNLMVFNTNAGVSGNGGFAPGSMDDELQGSALWVDFPTIESEFASQTQTDFSFTVSVPEGTPSGQYISAIVAETVEAMPLPGTEVFDHKLRYSISVGILVPGEITPAFEVGEPIWDRGYLAVPVLNTGNYLVRPSGEIVMKDGAGKVVVTSPVQMGSIYAGLNTFIFVDLPDQLASGDYSVDLTLIDPESGFTQDYEGVAFYIPEPEDTTGVTLAEGLVVADGEDLNFANVEIILDNGGSQLPSVDVTLKVWFDGDFLEDYPLAQNQVFLQGTNTYTTRYIPASGWESGTYSFTVEVSAVDPNGDQRIELLDEDLGAEIVVP